MAAALIPGNAVLLAVGVRLGKSSSRRAVEAKVNADGVQRQASDSVREDRSVLDYWSLSPGTPRCPTGAREGSCGRADVSPCFSSCSFCWFLSSLRQGWGQIWPVPSVRGPTCVSHSQTTLCPLVLGPLWPELLWLFLGQASVPCALRGRTLSVSSLVLQ